MGSGWKWCASLPGFALTRIGSGFHGSSPTLLSSDCDIMRIWATQGWRPHAGDGRVALQVLHCVLWDYLHETEIKSILFNLLYFGVSLSLSEPTHYAFKSYRPQHLNLLHQRVLEKSHIIICNHSVLKSNDFFYKKHSMLSNTAAGDPCIRPTYILGLG